MSAVPLRVLPNTNSETMIVRCMCHLRVASGPMIRCSRCGCWSHEKCVSAPVTPFTCTFCAMTAEKMLLAKFNKTATPGGIIVDHQPLHNALVGRLNPVQICEVREHCLASGHVCELLDKVAMFLAASEMEISQFENSLAQMDSLEPVREQLALEIANKRKLLLRHSEIVTRLAHEMKQAKREQMVIPALRDAVVNQLL